jgi:pimeloyl-ACP methyl ester carboxylesterase
VKNLYLFSGLGADKRAFQNLDLSDYNIHFIEWIQPDKNESIESYSKRLTQQIKPPNPILIGVSFGGMIAIEVAKLIETEKIIIISSAKTKSEIPFYYKLVGLSKLNKIIDANLFSKMSGVNYWMFGVENENDKKLLNDIIQDTNPEFLNWATDKIINWKNQLDHGNLKHIHGTSDKILPIRFVRCDVKVNDGGHFMIVNKADELSTIIKQLIEN